MSTIAILLPGITGTTLWLPNTSVPSWPVLILGTALASGPQEAALLLENKTLFPGDPAGWQCGNGYGSFANFFETLGFQVVTASVANLNNLPSQLNSNLLVGFGYDWRQDNTTSAGNLRTLLEVVHQSYGAGNQIFLIGHSMGGLVARAYLENSDFANDPWYASIAGLITLGTPHLGAPLALAGIMGTLQLPPRFITIDTLVSDFINSTYSDSSYELLPPNQTNVPQTAFLTYQSKAYSIFDPSLPSEVTAAIPGLSTSNLSKAQTFFNQLNYTGISSANPLPPYYCVAGNSSGTCESFLYENNALTEIDYPTSTIQTGDGVVPTWSALFHGREEEVKATFQVQIACNVTHVQLPGNVNIQKQVAQWMNLAT